MKTYTISATTDYLRDAYIKIEGITDDPRIQVVTLAAKDCARMPGYLDILEEEYEWLVDKAEVDIIEEHVG
jgi:hypothetical protein